MITLYSFGSNFGVVDPSPFVLKVDAYMKMAGIEHELNSDFIHFKNAPKGKLPYINVDDTVVSDSFFILAYLKEKYGNSIDDHISEEQKAIANLIIKSLDENFYWCIIYSRWVREDTWPMFNNTLFGKMPFPLKYIVPFFARKGVKASIIKQGLGKHSNEEIMQIAGDTLKNLSTILADKKYMFGATPCTLDAVVFAFVAELILVDFENSLNKLARSFDNLVGFCERINKEYYE